MFEIMAVSRYWSQEKLSEDQINRSTNTYFMSKHLSISPPPMWRQVVEYLQIRFSGIYKIEFYGYHTF